VKPLTPAQWTVLSQIPRGDWSRSLANRNTIIALDERGLIESECRGRFALDVFVRLTPAGEAELDSRKTAA
jgi:hypothetical protein